mgnify:FL=1
MEQTLPKLVQAIAEKYPEVNAQYSRTKTGDFIPTNYHDFFQKSLDFAGSLLELGLKRGDRIGLISDDRKEWQQADIGLLTIGAIDTPRGCDASEKDLSYILSFAECQTVIAENNSQVKKILNVKESLPLLKRIIAFDSVDGDEVHRASDCGVEILSFDTLCEQGHAWRKTNPDFVENELNKGQWDDLATIIFTSGTTGTPKGVMLTHGNFIAQLDELKERIFLNPGEKALCVLPVWHVFQRECEYVIMSQAASICYSKPIGSILLADFQKINPHIMPAVPRVFEAIYDGVWRKMRKAGGITLAMFRFFVNESILWCKIDRKLRRKQARFGGDHLEFWWPVLVLPWLLLYPLRLLGKLLVFRKLKAVVGKNFRAGIAGGGAYPAYIDEFFWAVGIEVVEGYGLTETAPVVSVRPIADPVFRTVGTPIRHVEVRIVDDNGNVLGKCRKGNLQVRGATVMKGYYKRDDLTQKVMTPDGWFDTGDIGILTVDNEIQLRGRKKDTIVLMGGENIEPVPIEQKLNTSRFIESSMVTGTNEKGEDQRYLVALIVPCKDELVAYAKENSIPCEDYEALVKNEQIKKLFTEQVADLISTKNGFKPFEKISVFELITKSFEVGVELSAKQDMMRFRIADIYKDKIAKLYTSKKD